jgi:hypothetical protein
MVISGVNTGAVTKEAINRSDLSPAAGFEQGSIDNSLATDNTIGFLPCAIVIEKIH